MKTAIIAGLPRNTANRIQAHMRRLQVEPSTNSQLQPGWQLSFFNPDTREPAIYQRQIDKLARLAAANNGAHILGLSKLDGGVRKTIRSAIIPFFRFVWLRNEMLRLIPSMLDEWVREINVILAGEDLWVSEVKPRDTASPLRNLSTSLRHRVC